MKGGIISPLFGKGRVGRISIFFFNPGRGWYSYFRFEIADFRF
jgi:hypothetical protein